MIKNAKSSKKKYLDKNSVGPLDVTDRPKSGHINCEEETCDIREAEKLMQTLFSEMHIKDPNQLRILAVTYNMAGTCPKSKDFFEEMF